MPTLEDEFGDIVKKARLGLGLTHEELATRSGLSTERIAAFERYEVEPERSEADELAKALHLHAQALWDVACEAYDPGTLEIPSGLVMERFVFPEMNSNAYAVHVEKCDETVLIDPGGDPAEILTTLDRRGWGLSAILLTHGHGDHVAGVEQVRQALGAVPVYAHPQEWAGDGLIAIGDSETFRVGALSVGVIASPGHTPFGVVFTFEAGVAAVGDTLFAGSLGGPLRGAEYYPQLLNSASSILNLPKETLLLPGHGPLTTVASERVHNPFVTSIQEMQ